MSMQKIETMAAMFTHKQFRLRCPDLLSPFESIIKGLVELIEK